MGRERAVGVVGRDAEVGRARAALERVAAASGHALLVTGEAGIGKTRLVEEVVGAAGDRFTVAAEAASQLESELPFAPLVRALRLRPDASDPHAAAVGALLAEPGGDPELLRLRVVEAIADLVERWSLQRPVLLVIEDLHWADEATLQTLDRLVRRLAHVGVLVVGTARPHPRPAALEVLQRTLAQVEATTIELAPLAEEVTLDLARQVLDAEPGPQLARALRQAGGNPLYVTELLAAADTELDRHDDVVDLPSSGVPESVRLAILRNLSGLPSATLEVLRVASVLGTRFDLRQLALAMDRAEPDVIDQLAPALAAGVVSDAGDRLAFHHDLVRDAVYHDQPAPVLAAWHRRAVERLHTAGLPADELVPHLLRADWRGVPEAAGWLADAGRAVRSRSLPVAVDLLTRALDHIGDRRDPHLRLDLAEALAASGHAEEEAATVLRPLLNVPPDTLSQAIRDRLVPFARPPISATAPAADGQLLHALETAGLSVRGQAQAHAIRAWLAWTEGRREDAEDLAARAIAIAVDTGEHTSASVIAGNILVRIAEGSGNFARAAEHARATLAHARAIPTRPELQLGASATLAIMLGSLPSKRAEADHLTEEALALANRVGLDLYESALDAVAAANAQRRGDWHDAAVRYDAALDALPGADAPVAGIAMYYARAAMLNVHRDELDLAQERLATAHDLSVQARSTGREQDELSFVHLAKAQVRLALGDHDGAIDAVQELAEFLDQRGLGAMHAIHLPYVAAIAWQAERPEAARTAVERAQRWLHTAQATDQDAHLDGLVRWGCARVDGDADALEELVVWADEPRPLWEWRPRIREDAAAVLAATDERDQAVLRLKEALALWDGAGARRDVARIRQSLRELGVRRDQGTRAVRPDTGWDSLTDAEWRVVAIVADGLIYREVAERLFISRRTVETHVAHVFHKLGVSSRRELTRLLQTREGRKHLTAASEPTG